MIHFEDENLGRNETMTRQVLYSCMASCGSGSINLALAFVEPTSTHHIRSVLPRSAEVDREVPLDLYH